MRDLYSPRNVAFMMLVGLVALLPVALKWRAQRRAGGGGAMNGGAAHHEKPGRGGSPGP